MNFPSRRGFLSSSVASLAVATLSQPAASSIGASAVLYRGLGPIELGVGATHILLSPARRRIGAARWVLLLSGLSTRRPPGVRYDLYLVDGDTPPADPPAALRIGGLDFGAGEARFDVAGAVRRWPDADSLTLSILPDGMPDPRAAPRIAALAIVD